MPTNLHAVLTGDLIASRRSSLEANERGMSILRAAARQFGDAWALDLRFTRFRGDGWQVLLENPQLVLDAMIFIRARLMAGELSMDTRVSAGIGPIDTSGTDDLSDATGQAFFVSGDHLDHARKRRFLIAGAGVGPWQNAAVTLIEELVSGWTAAQAEAAAISLLGDMTQEDIAKQLGVTRQAVQMRLAGAGYAALGDALHAFRNHDFAMRPQDD